MKSFILDKQEQTARDNTSLLPQSSIIIDKIHYLIL
jgi:hypothetical protein